jgi:hypothetical protein
MVPAKVMAGAVAVPPDALAELLDLANEVVP